MSALAGKQYQIKHKDDTFVVGICDAPKNPCLENVGACRTTNGQSTSLGSVNDELQLKQKAVGTPFLQYTLGSVCTNADNTTGTRFTTIEFICLTDGMSAEPMIIEDYSCELVIHFPTKAACQSRVECKTYDFENGREIDVTPLINKNDNYQALVNEKLLSGTKDASKVPSTALVSMG